jgi:predicted DNA binding protein
MSSPDLPFDTRPMSVITEVRVSANEFDLGRLFEAGLGPDAAVELEAVVPVGNRTVPYLQVSTDRIGPLLEAVRDGSIVDRVRVVDDYGEESLLALDWDADRDALFGALLAREVAILSARGRAGTWTFELRFEDASELEAFRESLAASGVDLDVARVYNPTSTGSDLSYGVTEPQREALSLAVERGYYEVPRRCTTAELGEAFGISDQAVSERLRRGVATLVEHTLGTGTEGRS